MNNALRDLQDALARLWPNRNDDEVFVFASGDVYDRDRRRLSIRQNLAGQRSIRNRINQ